MRLFLLRSLLAPIASTRWARFISRYHEACEAGPPPARVLAKPVRSYLHLRLGPRRRVEILRGHYRLFRELFSHACVSRICAGERIVLAELEARKGAVYRLELVASVRVSMQREGELAIVLARRDAHEPVAKLSLALARVDGGLAVLIGGLQGPSLGKRAVIEATRELYGLRPKDAVLLGARAFAAAIGAQSTHAVANRHHVLDRLRDTSKHADYDAYWLERGAIAGGPLGFVFIPLDEAGDGLKGRDGAKAKIVATIAGFVRANRPPADDRAAV